MKHKIGSALQNGYALPQKTIRYVLIFPAGVQVYLSNKRRETRDIYPQDCVFKCTLQTIITNKDGK